MWEDFECYFIKGVKKMHSKTKKRFAKWLFPLSLAVVLSACGGGSDDKEAAAPSSSASGSPSSSPSASPSASPSPSESASPSPSSSASASPSAASGNAEVTPGYQLFEDAANKISIEYPKDWTLVDNLPGAVMAAMSPVDGDQDTFQENVNLVVQDLNGQEIDLAQYVELTKQQLGQVITDYKFVDDDTMKAENGLEVAMLDYTGVQGQNDLYWRQAFVLNGGKAFVVTYTAAEANFDKYVEQFAEMVGSLTFH